MGKKAVVALRNYEPRREAVVAQIAHAIFGGGPLFFLVQIMSAAILVLAANTAYQDFPRLASILAKDRYMPGQFMNRGDRLVFSNGVVVLAVLLATLAVAWMVMLNQGGVIGMDLGPFLLVWGLLLTPTVVLWVSFLLAAYAVTRNAYGTYAVGFAALGLTVWALVENRMTWAGNWGLFGVLTWTDMGLFPMDRQALVLNRLMALGLAALFLYLACRLFARPVPRRPAAHLRARTQRRVEVFASFREAQTRLRVFDHCAIYLLIAGTYTAFALGTLRGERGWALRSVAAAFSASAPTVSATSLSVRPARRRLKTRSRVGRSGPAGAGSGASSGGCASPGEVSSRLKARQVVRRFIGCSFRGQRVYHPECRAPPTPSGKIAVPTIRRRFAVPSHTRRKSQCPTAHSSSIPCARSSLRSESRS